MKKNEAADLLMKGTLGVLLLFGASVPLFYLLITRNSVVWLDLGARVLRMALAAGIFWALRARHRERLAAQGPALKTFRIVLACVTALCLVLLLSGTVDKLYLTVYSTLDYRMGGMPRGVAVALEQVLGGDLLCCLLTGFWVLLFPVSRAKAARKAP